MSTSAAFRYEPVRKAINEVQTWFHSCDVLPAEHLTTTHHRQTVWWSHLHVSPIKGNPETVRVWGRALLISILFYFQLEMEENRQKTNKKAKQLRES